MTNPPLHIAIIGGGAAGYFAAIEAKRNCPSADITIFEKNQKMLAKVEITGGGRCNLTNSFQGISDAKQAYPRGHKLMKRLFKRFDHRSTYQWFEREGVSRRDTVTFKTESAVAVRMDCSEDLDFTRVILSNRMGSSLTAYEVTFYLDGDLLYGMKYLGSEFGGSIELDFARSESYTFELPYIVSGEHTLRTEISSELGSEISVVTFTEPERKPTQLTFSYNDITGQIMLLSGHNPLQTQFDITVDITVKGQVTYRHKLFLGVADPETVRFTESGQASCSIVPGLTAVTVDSGKLKELMDKIYSNTRVDASNAIGNGNARELHADITSVELKFTVTSGGATPGKTSVVIYPSSYLPVKYLYKGATWLRSANTTQTISPSYTVNGKSPYLIHSL